MVKQSSEDSRRSTRLSTEYQNGFGCQDSRKENPRRCGGRMTFSLAPGVGGFSLAVVVASAQLPATLAMRAIPGVGLGEHCVEFRVVGLVEFSEQSVGAGNGQL